MTNEKPLFMIVRVARPTNQLERIAKMYQAGLKLRRLARFEDHNGFDGIVLGHEHAPYHLEFTHHRGTVVDNAPTQDNLLVFYIPNIQQWEETCLAMENAGFSCVASYNPYWDEHGKTFEDPDGYRVVLAHRSWQA